jgi:DNA repair protein RadC
MKKIKLPKIKIKVSVSDGDRITVSSSEDVVNVCKSIFNADTIDWTEEMIMVCLNRANVVIGVNKIASGGFSGVVCDPKVIMTLALQCAASSVILAHNHPSGNLTPSRGDIDITRKIRGACEYLDIKLLDHVIITSKGSYSMLDNGDI